MCSSVYIYINSWNIYIMTITIKTIEDLPQAAHDFIAAMDDNTGEMILKIVNTSDTRENALLHLDGFEADGADLIQLKAKSGMSENTLDEPTMVYPTRRHISLEGTASDFTLEPFSLNILRIKKK